MQRLETCLAFCTVIIFEHLHKGVLGQAIFTNTREVCGLPAGSVQILLDLRSSHFKVGDLWWALFGDDLDMERDVWLAG